MKESPREGTGIRKRSAAAALYAWSSAFDGRMGAARGAAPTGLSAPTKNPQAAGAGVSLPETPGTGPLRGFLFRSYPLRGEPPGTRRPVPAALRHFVYLAALFPALAAPVKAQDGASAPLTPTPGERAARIAASLDNSVLASQVIMSGVDGASGLDQDMGRMLRECSPGAIMLFRYNLNTPRKEVRRFIAQCVEAAALSAPAPGPAAAPVRIPPLVAADHEGGQVHRFGPGIGRLPAAASWEELARQEGRTAALGALEAAACASGREIRKLGLNLVLAPVVETLNETNRAFLGDRGFSSDPGFTAAAAAAFIRGMERAELGCVIKHFPGNSGIDPHRGAPVLSGDREELARAAESFSVLLGDGSPRVTGVMLSHALVPAWDTERIGSLSPALIGRWLRGDLGYNGMVLADDFSMTASSSRLEPGMAAVLSLAAGADMVMAWPANLRQIRGAILDALERGTLSRGRLEEAAARIIAEKIRLGLL